jgi:hypothetical protein
MWFFYDYLCFLIEPHFLIYERDHNFMILGWALILTIKVPNDFLYLKIILVETNS